MEPIAATIVSAAMTRAMNEILALSQKQLYTLVIVDPGDAVELNDFGLQIAAQLGIHGKLAVVEPHSSSITPAIQAMAQTTANRLPIVIHQGDTLKRQAVWELFQTLQGDRPPLVIMSFSTSLRYTEATEKWPPTPRGLFVEKPILLPKLYYRSADVPGIFDALASALKAKDDSVLFSTEAKKWLIENPGATITAMKAAMRVGIWNRNQEPGSKHIEVRHLQNRPQGVRPSTDTSSTS